MRRVKKSKAIVASIFLAITLSLVGMAWAQDTVNSELPALAQALQDRGYIVAVPQPQADDTVLIARFRELGGEVLRAPQPEKVCGALAPLERARLKNWAHQVNGLPGWTGEVRFGQVELWREGFNEPLGYIQVGGSGEKYHLLKSTIIWPNFFDRLAGRDWPKVDSSFLQAGEPMDHMDVLSALTNFSSQRGTW